MFEEIQQDQEISEVISRELARQRKTVNLIASENFTPLSVLAAQGSILTNKYAEGYPGDRYYGGCEYVDEVETLAIERAKKLFEADHANVQPHSGSQANMAVYMACLKPGDVILGQRLDHGGHLTHGAAANFSGRFFRAYGYGVSRKTETIDYDEVRELARKYRPRLIVCGTSAYSRIINFALFREIADEVGALLMVDMAHFAGLVAAGIYPSPIPHVHFATSTTHKTLCGPRGGLILCTGEFAQAIDRSVFPGIQGGPLMHVIAAKAICFRIALCDEFKEYQKRVVDNARALSQALADRGFRIVSGGTDTHLFLVDLTDQSITGQQAEDALGRVGIVVNKNTIPYDSRGPSITSGIRVGTPAMTQRGMGKTEMDRIAEIMATVLSDIKNEEVATKAARQVEELTVEFPLYPEL